LFYAAWWIYQLHEKYMRLTIDLLKASPTPSQEVAVQSPRSMFSSDLSDDQSPLPLEEATESQDSSDEASANAFVDKVTKLIVERLSDSDFNINLLCREMAMSRTLFYVKLKSYTGKSPQDFIRIIRLERAALLLRGGHSVAEAAALSGFDNPKYFSTVFKKYFNVSPSKYQG
jgi:AraC-like DNA-binding protein